MSKNRTENHETPERPTSSPSSRIPWKSQAQRSTVVWSIAGFDPSSGAGVSADLMTFAAHGLFGCSAITALTVQNTLGVFASQSVAPEVLQATLDRLGEDLPPAGIKIGMLGSPELSEVVAGWLRAHRRRRETAPLVVLDPVLRSSSGATLFPKRGLASYREQLLPEVDWVTPNWAELEALTGEEVRSVEAAQQAATALQTSRQLVVVATGGDQKEPLDLLVRAGQECKAFAGRYVATQATHGTGCAFSSALLCELVKGRRAEEAMWAAKSFVEGALMHAPGLGSGRGPMELLWPLRG